MRVSDAVGRALAALEVEVVFGVMGSGNLGFTNAMREAGVRFDAARHEEARRDLHGRRLRA